MQDPANVSTKRTFQKYMTSPARDACCAGNFVAEFSSRRQVGRHAHASTWE